MESFNQWFWEPVKNQYFDFDGRATRQQFWMFILWSFIISFILGIVGGMFDMKMLGNLFSLAVFLPSLGIGARRLHDINKSGWWQLLWIIPIIGWIVLIVFLATQGQAGANQYGPDPRAGVTGVIGAESGAVNQNPVPSPEVK